jgi:predicted nucleic acid-binding protein
VARGGQAAPRVPRTEGRPPPARLGDDPGDTTRPLTFVVDASAVLDALLGQGGPAWSRLVQAVSQQGGRLAAPELMWSEATSVLHEQAWRGVLPGDEASRARTAIETVPIACERPDGLRLRAWEIADRMGWAKTYDAEYCALAELIGCPLVTGDRRLRRAGERLGYVQLVTEAADASGP